MNISMHDFILITGVTTVYTCIVLLVLAGIRVTLEEILKKVDEVLKK